MSGAETAPSLHARPRHWRPDAAEANDHAINTLLTLLVGLVIHSWLVGRPNEGCH